MNNKGKEKIKKYKDLGKTLAKKVISYKSYVMDHRGFLPDKNYIEVCKQKVNYFEYRPLISVILPTHNTPSKFLKSCIDSILDQVYQNFELCIVDDCSSESSNVRKIIENYANNDSRITYIFLDRHHHIVGTTNEAIKISNGEYLAFIDHDDLLTKNALFEIIDVLQSNREADLLYSDEDKIDEFNFLSEPALKPDFNLEYLLSFMYIGHLSVYRKRIVETAGLLREGTEGSQDYDLALRVIDLTDNIVHIPKILYHWRKHADSVALNPDSKPYAYEAMKRVLTEALKRRDEDAWLEETKFKGINRPRLKVENSKNILVIIFVNENTSVNSNLKIHTKLHKITRCINVSSPNTDSSFDFTTNEFDYSEYFKKCINKFTDYDFVLCLSNSIHINNRFLDELVEQCSRKNIAAVSAKIEDMKGKCLYGGYKLENNEIENMFFGRKAKQVPGAKLLVQRSIDVSALNSTLIDGQSLQKVDLSKLENKDKLDFEIALSKELKQDKSSLIWTPFVCCKSKKEKF